MRTLINFFVTTPNTQHPTPKSLMNTGFADILVPFGRKSKLRHSPVITEANTVLGTPSQCG
ncbi:MAG: hypothetical protein V7K71_03840 [Nostoc sp.]|uniref:hypothetical protein n=1 Tax=Nostoc sp. TaxID=1180 RepID=UPI002FFC48BC